MSVIQTIRERYAKVMFFVMILALLGFILMYATNDVRGLFSRSTSIGKIDGTAIDYKEYEELVTQRQQMYKAQNPNQSEDQQAQVRDEVWNQMVNQKLVESVGEKLGLIFTDGELKDMFTGPVPDPDIQQAFTNRETGEYNGQQALAAIQKIERSKGGEEKQNWEFFKSQKIQQKVTAKFNNMITGALYTPKAMLDAGFNDRNTYASVKFVQLPLTLVADKDVKVTDAEIQKYMEAHRAMFEFREPSRSFQYVAFDVKPTAADSAALMTNLDSFKAQMASKTGDDLNTFVSINSDDAMPAMDVTEQMLQGYGIANPAEIMNAPAGTVVGPVVAPGNRFILAKVVSKGSFPDSVTVRHILVTTTERGGQVIRTDSAAKARIDSVIAMAKGGVSFDSLAARYSDDPGSKDKGGKYDFPLAQKDQLVKPFADFAFSGAAGESRLIKVDDSLNAGYAGYHYVEIIKKGAPSSVAKVALIIKTLQPSEATDGEIYAAASDFARKVSVDPKSFDKNAQAAGVQTETVFGVNENSYLVGQLGSSRNLVKWTYDAKAGDVSPIERIGDRYVVAKLTGIQPAGLPVITDETRPFLEPYVRKEKKAKILADRNKGKALEAIAEAENQSIMTDDSVTMYRAKSGIAGEPRVLGYTFFKGLKEGTVSPGIEGNNSVVFLSVNSRTFVNPGGERNNMVEQRMSTAQMINSAPMQILDAMKKKAKVKDMRGKLYN